jgi:phage gpG-like protein
MAVPVFMNVKGVKALGRKMKKIGGGLSNRRKLNARVVVLLDRWIQKNFQQEGKLVGGWKPLSPATIAQRRKKGAGAKILQDTGQLRSRWKKQWTSKFAKVQSGVPYSEIHHKGLGNVPERQILPEEHQIKPQLIKLFGDYVKVLIK